MEEITFWDMISSHDIKKICIPTIQRDYAMGRPDKIYNRQQFLQSLKSALDGQKELLLDFVYGVDDATMFVPLDGQQRLTTLWLLHWYIAFKAGKLADDEVKKNLMKFSYETRISSSDFCESLLCLTPSTSNESLRSLITSQTCFFHHYRQDPTIMGMLNMIAGTKINDKSGNDIIDGLEEIFIDGECDFGGMWTKLTTTKCIRFYKLEVSLNDSDEIYVKMNARGKQLTDFENFKAELIHHVKSDEILGEVEALKFAAKLDVQWTDIFWHNRWQDKNTLDVSIDEIYFAFIRQFVKLECYRKNKKELAAKVTPEFTNFEHPYNEIIDKESVERFIKIMDNLRGHNICTRSPWGCEFAFVPEYKNDSKADITTLIETETETLIFYGYCEYLRNGEYDEDSFSQWSRVLWNICENRKNKSDLTQTMEEIDILAPHSHDIISYLSGENIVCKDNDQLPEEQCKARKLDDYPMIREMEGYAFFKGSIRFLYTGADGREDWESFNTKVRNVKELIPEKREERHTIKLLTPYIPDEGLVDLYSNNWISNNDEDLHTLFHNDTIIPYLHNFLLQNEEKVTMSSLHNGIINICEDAFGGKGYLQTKWSDSKYIWTNYVQQSGYYQWYSYILGNDIYNMASMMIYRSEKFEITKDQQDVEIIGNYIQGLFLCFSYKGYFFSLYANNTICLMKDKLTKISNPEDSNGYYFSVSGNETDEQLENKLDDIIEKYNHQSHE
jgi:hypothetical protein